MRYRNTSAEHRIWPALTNAETGATLELAPGQDAELAADPNDRRLTPLVTKPRSKPKPEPDAQPEPSEEN